MQYYYGSQNILRALDEAQFWKHQESEHATLIPLVTPNLEQQHVKRLEQFHIELAFMNAQCVKFIASVTRSRGEISQRLKDQMSDLVRRCLQQSKNFTDFMELLLKESAAVRSSQDSQEVINHMIRESQYFIGIDQLILGS